MNSSIKFVATAIVVLALGASAQGQVQPNAVQSQAQKGVVAGAPNLLKLAYVTAKAHTGTDYIEGKVFNDDSFYLVYKFSYKDVDGDPQTYTLKFIYNARGTMIRVDTVAHSSFWPPFNAIVIAGALVDEVSKKVK